MISYDQLAPLRLGDLLGPDVDVAEQDHWKWMTHTWIYEGIGFTWFGRLRKDPNKTAGFELTFSELSPKQITAVLSALELAVAPGMNLADLTDILGDPVEEREFVSDRLTYEFRVTERSRYRISATVLYIGGLIHVSGLKETLLRPLK